MQDWFSGQWFTYETFRQFEWANPLWLYGLIGIPFLFAMRRLFQSRSRQRLNVAFLARDVRTSWVENLRHLPAILVALGVAMLVIALARPQRVSQQVERTSEGIDIVLALDISDSMLEKDLAPNRLQAARQVARAFVKGRFQDRIGLVIFAGDAFALCPLTTDYQLLDESIRSINSSVIRTAGTAIGSALGVSINRLRESKSKSKVIILLSDGENTAGSLDPITAAQLAHAYGIRIYTIAVGKPPRDTGATGTGLSSLDESTLVRLAQIGTGQSFRAVDAQALKSVFTRIDQLERAEIKTSRYREVRDFYQIYLRWAIFFLLLSFLAKNTFIGNILED